MRMIPDNTKRFKIRPHFDREEIDYTCEALIEDFLSTKYGEIKFPISTEDIEELVRSNTSYFDSDADLSNDGKNIQGKTEFIPGEKPKVYVSKSLSIWQYKNRKRTTLTHELGHVILHGNLWLNRNVLERKEENLISCNRESILNAKKKDWLEWQAGYASGSFLMPMTYIKNLAEEVHDLLRSDDPVILSSPEGHVFVGWAVKDFSVSRSAATVRLSQLGYITEREVIKI